MTNKEIKDLSLKMIEKISAAILENDIEKGKSLEQICDNNKLLTNICKKKYCTEEHQYQVKKYIADIDKRYALFVKLYIIINSKGEKVTDEKGPINCNSLSVYIFILETIKLAKNSSKSIIELIKKEEN